MTTHNSTTGHPMDETTSENQSPDQVRARERLRKLIDEQGVRPLSIAELDALGDLWPEEENIDDFLAALREWRSEKSYKKGLGDLLDRPMRGLPPRLCFTTPHS